MDLNSLLVFTKVAENLSFTKAAKELGIEKSGVSMKISDLESRLGVRLLHRSTRSVVLSEAGEKYYHYCRQIVDKAQEAEDFIKEFGSEPQGLLRISGPNGIGRILFKDLISKFLKDNPSIDVQVNLESRMVNLVQERFDIALRACKITPTFSSLVTEHIFKIEWGFWTSSEYLKIHKKINTLNQFESHSFISSEEKQLKEFIVYKGNNKYSFIPKQRVTINNMDACVYAIQEGIGIGLLPTSAVKDEVKNGSIVQVLADYKVPSTELFAIYPRLEWQAPKIQKFLEFLHEWKKDIQ
ncbi:MAG: hypothetical protein COA71_07030 [SAR86 cluster bacterium]|uniref:HTH lysR-type domain-containing protein n=1 Tax=SAR86 cluster bacterium TaxID=2030880 RepID=A0A2A5CD42_9GAMM|nr:LysR family transcriptional regulator [Gammaproteobacteria bacterium AH-315-E17]PCJ41759.1 MAG: hypothetical protein COA71_07030 [SAR86 cluster bacterium]